MTHFLLTFFVCSFVFSIIPLWLWRKHKGKQSFGIPNWITFSRNLIVSVIIPTIFLDHFIHKELIVILLSLAFLALDGLDGYYARKLKLSSEFGARFDMESDAFFIFVLSFAIYFTYNAPLWVLMIGLMRYFYVILQYIFPALNRPVKDLYSRKVICVIQTVSLLIPFTSFFDKRLWVSLLVISLVLLTFSFSRDIYDQIRSKGHHHEVL